MHEHAPSTLRGDHVNRRGFLTLTGIASATAILGIAPPVASRTRRR